MLPPPCFTVYFSWWVFLFFMSWQTAAWSDCTAEKCSFTIKGAKCAKSPCTQHAVFLLCFCKLFGPVNSKAEGYNQRFLNRNVSIIKVIFRTVNCFCLSCIPWLSRFNKYVYTFWNIYPWVGQRCSGWQCDLMTRMFCGPVSLGPFCMCLHRFSPGVLVFSDSLKDWGVTSRKGLASL